MKNSPVGALFCSMAAMIACGCVERTTVRFVSPCAPAMMMAPSPHTVPPTTAPELHAIEAEEALTEAAAQPLLEVHFINVGQGDCTLVKCPNGSTILVDAGSSTGGFDASDVRSYLLSQLDPDAPRVDALVITHADSDHYDLIPFVLEGVDVGHVFTAGYMTDHTEENVDDWLEAFDPDDRTRLAGTAYNVAPPNALGDFGEVEVLVLASNVSDTTVNSEKNTHSIVLKVTYGTIDILLTGDATHDTENSIIARLDPALLDVEVLKLGHHGSNATSTSAEWAAAVRPEIAVASAGKNNNYGHPHRDVVARIVPYTVAAEPHAFRWSWRVGGTAQFEDFEEYTEAVYSTAVNGNIVLTTDGTTMDLTHDE